MLTATTPFLTTLSGVEIARRARVSYRSATVFMLGLALCAVPVSIAVTESLLGVALVLRLMSLVRREVKPNLPPLFWFWLIWAGLEIGVWLISPDLGAGHGEIRHLLLIAALFLLLPALDQSRYAVKIWRGIFLLATISSLALIGDFVWRLVHFRHEIALSPDPSFYLRTGGLLNHWAIYGTVEIMVFAALIEYWSFFPRHRRFLAPAFGVQGMAIVLSLTRALWIGCLALLILHLAWRRSKWILATPLLPAMLFVLAPVRFRVTTAMEPSYYSNAERFQMLEVGARMIRDKPLTGVGPGRVEALYRNYLSPKEPVPAYHGHLHNNLFQLAAEFGLPVACVAALFAGVLFRQLREKWKSVTDVQSQFLCRTSLLGLTGFLVAGAFDYTYGHSLGLILLSYVVITPLVLKRSEGAADHRRKPPAAEESKKKLGALNVLDRAGGVLLFASSLPVLIPAAMITWLLSGRSPFIAHLRIGKDGELFWVWKLRTMWPRGEVPSPEETSWVQRIERDPQTDHKTEQDPRITSSFARFCRRYSIDELPQFFHVMRGQMSLVGPRPLTRGELSRHYGDRATEILALKPGLTGYWQTRGRNRLSYPERVALDLELARDLSAAVYLQLLFRTIPLVLRGENAW